MFSKTSLLTAVLLSVAVAAKPVLIERSPVNVGLTKHVNVTSGLTMVEAGRARAAAFRAHISNLTSSSNASDDSGDDETVTNAGVIYTASIGVGADDTSYDLLLDTGSSNTWVGADKAYTVTSTSTYTGYHVEALYGSGYFFGKEYIDEVTITDDLVIPEQSIGVATISIGFSGYDGILGIGPVDLTEGTLVGASTTEIPTVANNLYTDGTISEDVIGIFFQPDSSDGDTTGVLTWGGVDSSYYSGDITYTDITTTAEASYYWGIDQSVTYGSSGTTIMSSTAGIVDTGTTLIYLPSDAYEAYVSATGASEDILTGMLKISATDYDSLESLYFTIGGTEFELTPDAQVWPRTLNTDIGGTSSDIYLIIADMGSDSGDGLDFINGYTFLERFYSVFDTTNSRVGFATTAYTDATTNYSS
ncbi:acid protease [Fistulina hepatica ATCC 64428]|uniref:Acid protease n=1 Tax=Fistulina hepatica ATCC 64428 TaxID=1128425 RepID=A0A0D6ZZ74_9AGAR|nr:acid protease [Fistulina hepatica ATCC 64428]